MVHPVTLHKKKWSSKVGCVPQEYIEYFLESWYILASILFFVGSVYFTFPNHDSEIKGCRLYDIGSIMFAAGAFLYLWEALVFRGIDEVPQVKKKKNRCRRLSREVGDQTLYCLGSVVFLVGTLIWDPDLIFLFQYMGGSRQDWLRFADILFMVGSFMFSFASFVTATRIHKVHQLFKTSAVIIVSCYEFGGFFFIAGTMCYFPGFRCEASFRVLGGILYCVGSLLYSIGCVLSMLKTIGTFQVAKEHWRAAERLQRVWRRRAARTDRANSTDRASSLELYSTPAPSDGGSAVVSSTPPLLATRWEAPHSPSLSPSVVTALTLVHGDARFESCSPRAVEHALVAIDRLRFLSERRKARQRWQDNFGDHAASGFDDEDVDRDDRANLTAVLSRAFFPRRIPEHSAMARTKWWSVRASLRQVARGEDEELRGLSPLNLSERSTSPERRRWELPSFFGTCSRSAGAEHVSTDSGSSSSDDMESQEKAA